MNDPNAPIRSRRSPPTPTDPDLVDRLARLRSILPQIATDLATARRHAHALELENQHLAARIAELESKLTSARDSHARPAR